MVFFHRFSLSILFLFCFFKSFFLIFFILSVYFPFLLTTHPPFSAFLFLSSLLIFHSPSPIIPHFLFYLYAFLSLSPSLPLSGLSPVTQDLELIVYL